MSCRLSMLWKLAFFGFISGGLAGCGFHGQLQGAKAGLLTKQHALLTANLAIQGAPSGIDDASGVRNRLDTVLHQAINGIVLLHILEEVFLAPPCEHGRGDTGKIAAVVGRENRALMAARVAVAHFAHPQAVGEAHAAFGQLEGDFLGVDQAHGAGTELFEPPVCSWELVIGEDGDALLTHGGEEFWRVALAIKDDGEAML